MSINNDKNAKKSNEPTTIYSTNNNKNKPSNKTSSVNARTKIYTPNTKNLK